MLEGLNRFSQNPVNLEIKRSSFNRSSQLKTTFNAGKLIPIYVDEVYPGDTFSMETSMVCRGSTPVNPVMDNSYIDTYWFFVPYRLVWSHWKEFMGENTNGYWIPQTEKTIPQITFDLDGDFTNLVYPVGSIADYFGIPAGKNLSGFSFSALPFRAYGLIWNEFFRDQNTQAPLFVPTTDNDNDLTYDPDLFEDNYTYYYFGACNCLPVNKFHDYFTSCLPGPSKGPSVEVPLGDIAPIITDDSLTKLSNPIKFGTGTQTYIQAPIVTNDLVNNKVALGLSNGTQINSTNLVADLSNATASTINQLRQAFAVQRLYEKDARGGTRYREMIKAHFGVTSPDARQQVPECLGGKRIPINMNQVVQTSSTDTTTPQGNTAAFSCTSDKSHNFVKSFTEHGLIIGLACVRTEHTYQQGVERFWNRKRRFDFYFPALANIGEQPVYNREIFVQDEVNHQGQNDAVFGYQEAWADLRYKPSRTSGYMRSGVTGSLDVWHYGDDFNSKPVLNSQFMQETAKNVDRTLAVQSENAHQYIADFYFNCVTSRPMPVYSIPGLVDHN